MRPGALTQAARNAAAGKDVAGARTADRRRTARTAPDAPGERRASRPPRRVSGPAKGKEYAGGRTQADARTPRGKGTGRITRAQGAASTPRAQGAARTTRAQSATRTARAQSAARVNRLARAPIVARAGGSAVGVVAAAVAIPLRPFVTREPAPRTAPARRPAAVPKPAPAAKPARKIGGRVGAFVLSLPDHSFLDRVVRGRAWIPLLGVLLAGIVAAQVEILKLGASMGRSLEQTTTLTSQNEQLRASVAALSDDQRIEHLATNMGMVLPPPGAVGYFTVGPGGEAAAALTNIHAPDATAFMALTPTNGALVTGAGTSMLPTSSGVLEQAGTPGSATPTTTPSATSIVPSAVSSTATTPATSGATTGTATTQAPPAEQPPPATTETPTTDSQTATSTSPATTTDSQTDTQNPAQTDTQTDSQTSGTGAAGVAPAGSPQQGTGG